MTASLPEPWPLSMFIGGHPRAYGSKVPNSWGHGVRDSSKYIKAWKDHVRKVMEVQRDLSWHALGVLPIPRGTAVGVAFKFFLPTPKSHRPAKDPYPVAKSGNYSGDWDKMARAIGDCMVDAGLIWDDCQIVDGLVQQRWASDTQPAGVLVAFWPVIEEG